jgi:hypothetical protein
MLGIRGAAAVTEDQKLVTAPEHGDQRVDNLHQSVKVVAQERLLNADAFVEG